MANFSLVSHLGVLNKSSLKDVCDYMERLSARAKNSEKNLKADLHGTTLSHAIFLLQVYDMNRFV